VDPSIPVAGEPSLRAAAAGHRRGFIATLCIAGSRGTGALFFFSRRGLEGWGSGKIVVISAKFRGNCGRKGDGQLPKPCGASFHWLHVACGSRRWLEQRLHM